MPIQPLPSTSANDGELDIDAVDWWLRFATPMQRFRMNGTGEDMPLPASVHGIPAAIRANMEEHEKQMEQEKKPKTMKEKKKPKPMKKVNEKKKPKTMSKSVKKKPASSVKGATKSAKVEKTQKVPT